MAIGHSTGFAGNSTGFAGREYGLYGDFVTSSLTSRLIKRHIVAFLATLGNNMFAFFRKISTILQLHFAGNMCTYSKFIYFSLFKRTIKKQPKLNLISGEPQKRVSYAQSNNSKSISNY